MQIIRLIKDLSVKFTRSPGNALCREQFASEHDRNVPTFPLCPLAKKEYQIAMIHKPPFISSFGIFKLLLSRDAKVRGIDYSEYLKYNSILSSNLI